MLYIRVKDTNIVKGFSDSFEKPTEGDICIDQGDSRHFQIAGEVNPPLCNIEGVYLYKYLDGAIIKKTAEEIAAETQVPVVVPDPTQEKISSLIKSMDFILLELMSTV